MYKQEDAATVFIRLIGLNLYETDGENYRGRIVMSAAFASDAEKYRWLNRELGVVEAVAWAPEDPNDPRTERWTLRGYASVNELDPVVAI